MEEIWNKVRNYENYEVSNLGGVRSLNYMHTEKIKLLSQANVNGYLKVGLWKDGKCKFVSVHRLVWETFNGLIPEGMQVNHINENKTDNRLENLNLMTPKENTNWGNGIKRHADKQLNDHRSKPVLQFTLDGELVKEWPSAREAHRNGFNQANVSRCCLGKQKQYKGFIWKFKNA